MIRRIRSGRVVAMLTIATVIVPHGLAVAAPCLLPPVDAPIADAFRAPACEWCAGNRGLEYAPTVDTPVRAAAAGVVTFAGNVAGTMYIVVEHVDGVRATYGRLARADVSVGARLPAGAVVGRSGPGTLYFGLRRGEEYLDPAPLLARIVRQPRLVPTDGTPPRPAPPPRWRCPDGEP